MLYIIFTILENSKFNIEQKMVSIFSDVCS
jgi:hypothetical protein